ncbi:uncharacterized protein A4U43_C04F19230 [Asparagus officinalis]|uniref:Uncharacterized protein n=1 Tax=Asparagus officinalis TaxID=4686 RepID=A0A5P1F232_ASPOF|nr:uncharacterized protein A4U43_C04F19230 [Asparagus officinalis]
MIPFAVRYLYVELLLRLNSHAETVDQLYELLDFVRARVREGSEESECWRRREVFILSSICCNHWSWGIFSFRLRIGWCKEGGQAFEAHIYGDLLTCAPTQAWAKKHKNPGRRVDLLAKGSGDHNSVIIC